MFKKSEFNMYKSGRGNVSSIFLFTVFFGRLFLVMEIIPVLKSNKVTFDLRRSFYEVSGKH